MNVKISSGFKKMTLMAILSIVAFIIIYLLLLIISLSLTAICGYLGLSFFFIYPHFFSAVIGVGLFSMGLLLLMFLFKFIFKRHKTDLSHLTEVTQSMEPELFKMIEEIVNELHTKFPKHVYFSASVNASVFYDSGFWSMFLPVRKNLEIGMGLINTTSREELKAILSHEFGHFSQRSMKVGSYVYQVNQVIFNMLYDNESFDKTAQKWSNIHSVLKIFVYLSVQIVKGIQAILKKMYEIVNLNYLGLLREMEFYADEVAASVTGPLPLKESLLRLQLSDFSLNSAMAYYNNKISENITCQNIFRHQRFVMNFQAQESGLKYKHGIPLVTQTFLNKYNRSKLIVKDQWASHPTTEERISALEKLKYPNKTGSEEPARSVLKDAETTEMELTKKLFSNVVYEGTPIILENEKFEQDYQEDFFKNSFDPRYKGYYDTKDILNFDLNSSVQTGALKSFDELFSTEIIESVYEYNSLLADKNTLEGINNSSIKIKSFDYNGKRYKTSEATELINRLEREIETLKEALTVNDQNIFQFFFSRVQEQKSDDALIHFYQELFEVEKTCNRHAELYNEIVNNSSFIYLVTPYQQIRNQLEILHQSERKLKAEIRLLIQNKEFETEIPPLTRTNFGKYLADDLQYFLHENYVENNLQIMFTAANDFILLSGRYYFIKKRNLLNFQLSLIQA